MRLLTILLTLAGASMAALAQPKATEVRKISLEECIQGALNRNFDLQIARYNPPMALADLRAAYAGWDPNLSLSGNHNFSLSGGGFNATTVTNLTPPSISDRNSFNSALGGLTPWGLSYSLQGGVSETYGRSGSPFDSSSGQALVTLTQPLLKNFWIDQTRLNIRVAKNRLKYSELGLKQIIMTTATQVEQAYYDLIYFRTNVGVQEKALTLAEQLVAENQKRVEVGTLAQLDLESAKSQAESSRADLANARNSLAKQENLLKQLFVDDFSAWDSVELQPTPETLEAPRQLLNRQDSWSKALTQRPDLLQAKLDVERQGVTLKYNYNQLFPELDLVGTYGHSAGGASVVEFGQALDQFREGNRPFYSYGAQLTIPLSNLGARAAYRKSKLALEQLVLTLKKLEQGIMITVANDIDLAQSSFEQVGARRRAAEYAAADLDAERKKLDSGKSTTYTVLQKQRDLTTALGNEILALDNYNKALSQLSLDEGATLERLRINVELTSTVFAAAPLSLHAVDTEAQTKAREALEKKMQELQSQPPQTTRPAPELK